VTRRWRRLHRYLAGAAALAGALAPFAGSPYRRSTAAPGGGSLDVAELARTVADQEDHVSAVELATWIRAGRPRLRIVDVRSADEFRAFHIPGAEHVPLDRIVHAPFSDDETVVLYSEVGIHGAQAWVFLRALGHRRVYFLRNGLHEWLDDVMSPTLAENAPADAEAAFARVAELSRWFGGMPRRVPRTTTTDADNAALARRRGC
jgi:rhodanese-related sulfurtransferase